MNLFFTHHSLLYAMSKKSILTFVPLAFLAIFFFYPLIVIFARGLAPEGVIDLSAFSRIVSNEYYLQTLWFTLWQAVVSTALTVLVALPAAYVFARFTFRGKSLLHALTTIPFVLPTVVVAASFSALIGPRGWINELLKRILNVTYAPIDLQNTIWVILLAHVFYNFTIVLRLVGGFWSNLDPQIENAARVLGANRWRTFFEVTLPLLKPAVLAASLLVFIFDFTSFGVILILGGPQFNTIETAIYRKTQIALDLPLATALAIVQLACTFALMAVYTKLQARASVPLDLRPRRAVQRRPITRGEKTLVLSVVFGILFVLLAPLMALAAKSLVNESGFTLSNYVNLATNPRGSVLFVPPLTALGNSLVFALTTMLIALIVGLLAAYSSDTSLRAAERRRNLTDLLRRPNGLLAITTRLLEPIWLLPLGASAVTLGFGFLIGFPQLRSSWLMLPLAHSLVAFPFVVRTITPALRSIRSNLREAASVMGANPWRVWREVDLPIIARALLIGGAFAFSVSMGEFGATAMISRADTPTLPYAIFRYLSQPGSANYGQAMAMSTLLMIVVSLSLIAIERFRFGEVGEF
ncbi:MAG: iron ABC transporter permease [Thermoflexales bacterium]|nr:iron ABC transporter permease [Thermoflexales bacterium]